MARSKVTKESLEAEVVKFDKVISDPKVPESIKKAMHKAKEEVQRRLKAFEEAPKEKPAEAKKEAPKKESKEKPATGKKKKPVPEKIRDEDRYVTVLFHGKEKTFDITKCDEAIQAMFARKERDKETNAKTKSRLPVEKVKTSLEHTTTHITDMVPDKMVAEHPEKVISFLKSVNKDFDKIFDKFKQIGLTPAQIEKLKKGVDRLQDAILEIEKELEEKK